LSIHRAAATGFAKGAAPMSKGRPDYPPEVEDWLRSDLALRKARTVLDLRRRKRESSSQAFARNDAAIIAVGWSPANVGAARRTPIRHNGEGGGPAGPYPACDRPPSMLSSARNPFFSLVGA